MCAFGQFTDFASFFSSLTNGGFCSHFRSKKDLAVKPYLNLIGRYLPGTRNPKNMTLQRELFFIHGPKLGNNLNPDDPLDAEADNDGDGMTNLAEFTANTDPSVADASDSEGDDTDTADEASSGGGGGCFIDSMAEPADAGFLWILLGAALNVINLSVDDSC